eukprot:CAMPEP_0194575558 /NCGR_PEP_ID=MMETSP0292-20121207/11005_1 /TAXON_ID=39354 /ORGANISM="Heterosigma akashiwo, Strain CCMP2393" /LENGTH=121 /DNA_ID=CAMNT_0039427391 /DNA_START=97 /DNA_END=462 /DNA_ORIENTATION=+
MSCARARPLPANFVQFVAPANAFGAAEPHLKTADQFLQKLQKLCPGRYREFLDIIRFADDGFGAQDLATAREKCKDISEELLRVCEGKISQEELMIFFPVVEDFTTKHILLPADGLALGGL